MTSLRERLEQLSEEELTALQQEKEQNPSLWERVTSYLSSVFNPDPEPPPTITKSQPPPTTPPPSDKELSSPPTTEDSTSSSNRPDVSPRLPGDVYRDQMIDIEPPQLQDFSTLRTMFAGERKRIQEELNKLTPNRYEQVLARGERDLSKLKVSPEVYQRYKDTLDQAYQEYKSETDRIRKAELWSGIAKALGYLVMARFSNNALAPTQYGWKDFDANRYLAEARDDLNAKLSIAKSKLTEDQRAAAEERQIEAIRDRDEDKLLDAYERDRLERKQDLLRLNQQLDQKEQQELNLRIYDQNKAIQAYNMLLQRNDKLFRYGEQADAKALNKAMAEQQRYAQQLQQELAKLQRQHKALGDEMKRSVDRLPTVIRSVFKEKRTTTEEKLNAIRTYITNTNAFSKAAQEDILDSVRSGIFSNSVDKEALLEKVDRYIQTEAQPLIERLRSGYQHIWIQRADGTKGQISPENFVKPEVQALLRQGQWQVLPTYYED